MAALVKKSRFTDHHTEYYEDLLGNSPSGVLICNQEGEVRFANRALSQIFGEEINREDSGLNIHDLNWVRNTEVQCKFRELTENGHPFQTTPIGLKDCENKELHLSIKAAPLKGEDERMNGFICFVEDISEKIQLKQNLKEKSRELSIINEVSLALSTTLETDQILEMILIGVTADQGLGFNRAFLLLLDEKENHLVGKMAMGTSDPKEAGRIWEQLSKKKLTFREVLQSYRKTVKQKDVEVKRITENLKISMQDDESILVQAVKKRSPIKSGPNHQLNRSLIELLGTNKFVVIPLVSKDKAIGVILADNLITSKPIREEGIRLLQIFASQASIAIENSGLCNRLTRQVEELEEANNALAQNAQRMMMIEKFSIIGQITSSVAHQLRNPMTVIGGFAKSLLKKANLDDPQYNSLTIIAGQTDRMESILNRFLDFTPKARMELRESDLNLIVEKSLKMVKSELTEARIALINDLKEDIGTLLIDAGQLQVALVNVLRNSIQAISSGGELRIRTWKEDGQARIEIKDTGTGIAEKDLSNIFDPFYTTRDDADGLGLTVAYEIIKNQKGQMWAKSKEGEGTSIFIHLPMRRGEDQ
jgi:PAS domain S-box-containing protein